MAIRVMLCCGAGMSSGFLATRVRNEAKKAKVDLTCEAKSEAMVPSFYGKIDILLLGPHYANKLPTFQEAAAKNNFKVAVIPQKIYGALDGKGLLDMIQSM